MENASIFGAHTGNVVRDGNVGAQSIENYAHTGNVIKAVNIVGNVNTHTHVKNAATPSDIKLTAFIGPVINFVGRTAELNLLKTALSRHPHIMVVSGLGGVGKTQLVRKFIDKNRTSYDNIIWINAQERAKIEEQFKTLAKDSLNIRIESEGKQRDFDAIVRDVYAKLSETQAIIVLDNVDKKDDCKGLTLATLGKRPHVTITSRIRDWKVPKIELGVFNVEDALQYVSKTLNDQRNEENDSIDDLMSLVLKLERFPLALRQAKAYIIYQREVKRFRIVEYINEYNKQSVLDSEIFKDETNEYAQTTFTTWKVTLAAIEKCGLKGELALRILRIMAFFDPDRIRREILYNLELPGIKIEEQVISAVRLLVNYSMVNSQEHQSVLSVHRLVQQVIRLELENAADIMQMILRDGLRLISKIEKGHENYYEVHEHGAPVFLSAVKFYELIDEFSSFALTIMESFFESFKFARAINFGNEAVASLPDILGLENSTTIALKAYIAYSYNDIGKHIEALQMYQKVYERLKNVLGEDHPSTLSGKHKIAYSFSNIGKHPAALQIYKDVYERQKNILGEDHVGTLTTKHNIAQTFSKIGKHSEALEMYQEVYERLKNILEEDHPSTLTTKHNIAHSFSKIGKHSVALQMYQEVYEQKKNVLGEDHHSTLSSKHNIAQSVSNIGKHTAALQMFKEVYERQKNILGEDHPSTLITKHNIALSVGNNGKHSAALQMFKEVYEQMKNILGEDHADTLTTKHNIAQSYINIGKHSESIQMYEEVSEQSRNILRDHPDTLAVAKRRKTR